MPESPDPDFLLKLRRFLDDDDEKPVPASLKSLASVVHQPSHRFERNEATDASFRDLIDQKGELVPQDVFEAHFGGPPFPAEQTSRDSDVYRPIPVYWKKTEDMPSNADAAHIAHNNTGAEAIYVDEKFRQDPAGLTGLLSHECNHCARNRNPVLERNGVQWDNVDHADRFLDDHTYGKKWSSILRTGLKPEESLHDAWGADVETTEFRRYFLSKDEILADIHTIMGQYRRDGKPLPSTELEFNAVLDRLGFDLPWHITDQLDCTEEGKRAQDLYRPKHGPEGRHYLAEAVNELPEEQRNRFITEIAPEYYKEWAIVMGRKDAEYEATHAFTKALNDKTPRDLDSWRQLAAEIDPGHVASLADWGLPDHQPREAWTALAIEHHGTLENSNAGLILRILLRGATVQAEHLSAPLPTETPLESKPASFPQQRGHADRGRVQPVATDISAGDTPSKALNVPTPD